MKRERDELDTKKIHGDEAGNYSFDRKALHSKIIEKFLSQSKSNENKVIEAVLLGGGSNSGKSTISENLPEGLVIIDPDEIKREIPEYKEYQEKYPKYAALYVHDESSDIGQQLLNKTIEEEKSLVYDGTMKNSVKYKGIIEELRAHNYFITMIIVDVPLELALMRNKARFQETGRAVPESIIIETHVAIPDSFIELKDLVDEYYLYDTRQGKEILVAQKTINEGEEVLETDFYQEFLRKSENK